MPSYDETKTTNPLDETLDPVDETQLEAEREDDRGRGFSQFWDEVDAWKDYTKESDG